MLTSPATPPRGVGIRPGAARALRAAALLAALGALIGVRSQAAPQAAQAHSVSYLDLAAGNSRAVLTGPPATAGMRSGYVVLAPGRSVGQHSTESNEEVVIVFAGTGELRFVGRPPIALRAGAVAYNPPRTTHDVVNTGAEPLRYQYVVAAAGCGSPR
jgi:quercetin dioxygenase-like cupin family protein